MVARVGERVDVVSSETQPVPRDYMVVCPAEPERGRLVKQIVNARGLRRAWVWVVRAVYVRPGVVMVL